MSSSAAPLLEVKNLHVAYGAIKALHGVDLRVMPGEIVTLIGSNGAGKTTALRAISGMVRCARGEVVFSGEPVSGCTPNVLLRRGLCHCPEGRGIFANMTVSENLDLGAFIHPQRTAPQRATLKADRERVLTLFPRLRERLRQSAGTLSGGEQQMLAIARALLSRPTLLLLDEPSLGLAPQLVKTIFQIIRDINRAGTTILLVEQNAHMALNVAHHAVVLETGSVAMAGPAKEVAASDAVKKAYLGHG